MRVRVTGAAGFIGMRTSLRLLERGDEVVGCAPAPPVAEGVARFVAWYRELSWV